MKSLLLVYLLLLAGCKIDKEKDIKVVQDVEKIVLDVEESFVDVEDVLKPEKET